MLATIDGLLLDKRVNDYKDKKYFSFSVYCDKQIVYVSVRNDIFDMYNVGDIVALECGVFIKDLKAIRLYTVEQ